MIKPRPKVTLIATKFFDIAFMGRSGSRSILYDVARKDSWTTSTPRKEFMKTWLDLNVKNLLRPKILVLRNPIDRAKSAIRNNLEPEYHTEPFLHYINSDVITHIIKFEELPKYVNAKFGLTDCKDSDVDVSEYDFEHEMILYDMMLQKPVYPAELFKQQVIMLHR